MKTVVDTNVVAYLLLGLGTANVLWMATRSKILAIEEATARRALADGLGIHGVPNRRFGRAR